MICVLAVILVVLPGGTCDMGAGGDRLRVTTPLPSYSCHHLLLPLRVLYSQEGRRTLVYG